MIRDLPPPSPSDRQAGNALLPAVFLSLILAGFAGSTLTVVHSNSGEIRAAAAAVQAEYLAEAAARLAAEELRQGGSGVLGSAQQPETLGTGAFYTQGVRRAARRRGARHWSPW